MSTFSYILYIFLYTSGTFFYTRLTFFNYMINIFLNIYFLCLPFLQKQLAHSEPISSSRPTVGQQDAISPQWADRGQSASCRPTGVQSACCGPTRPSRPAAGRRCIIFEIFLSSVIFMKINKKCIILKKQRKRPVQYSTT